VQDSGIRYASEDTEKDLQILKYLVRQGDWVIDIGANIGLYTKLLSQVVGENGRVISIEPIPLTSKYLSYNVNKLRMKNVNPINIAISNSDCDLIMEIPKYETGGENYYQARIPGNISTNVFKRMRVKARRLDSIANSFDHAICLIKWDVEGHEMGCIEGARYMIRKYHPMWFMEVCGDRSEDISQSCQIFEILKKEGYDGYWFTGICLKRLEKEDRSINYLFLRQEHLELIKAKEKEININILEQ
jgi:FkbM family methyltransferase